MVEQKPREAVRDGAARGLPRASRMLRISINLTWQEKQTAEERGFFRASAASRFLASVQKFRSLFRCRAACRAPVNGALTSVPRSVERTAESSAPGPSLRAEKSFGESPGRVGGSSGPFQQMLGSVNGYGRGSRNSPAVTSIIGSPSSDRYRCCSSQGTRRNGSR